MDEQLSVQSALGRAVRHDELRVLFQPIVRLSDSQVCGAEALVRWQRPGHGLLTPDRFIPMAEQSDLVTEVDRWLLAEACRRSVEWCRRGGVIAVNVSARTLTDEQFPRTVADVLAETGTRPSSVVLEITETAVLSGSAAVSATLRRLRELGVQLSIDDFGTGYSSLAQLSRTAVDVLKIDRSFVAEMDTDPAMAAIVSAVVRMGRALGQHVVAEGVERPGQADMLREMGCTYAQGWLFGRPGDPAVVDDVFALADDRALVAAP